jgi:hypothetical protein
VVEIRKGDVGVRVRQGGRRGSARR